MRPETKGPKPAKERMHPRRLDAFAIAPMVIMALFSFVSFGGLYREWLEPIGLHIWMEGVFKSFYGGFDRYADDPLRHKVMFSWIVVGSCMVGLLTALVASKSMYRYVLKNPKPFGIATGVYLVMLAIVLLPEHGSSRGARSLYYSGLFGFVFCGAGLAGGAFYMWTTVISGFSAAINQLLGASEKRHGT